MFEGGKHVSEARLGLVRIPRPLDGWVQALAVVVKPQDDQRVQQHRHRRGALRGDAYRPGFAIQSQRLMFKTTRQHLAGAVQMLASDAWPTVCPGLALRGAS